MYQELRNVLLVMLGRTLKPLQENFNAIYNLNYD